MGFFNFSPVIKSYWFHRLYQVINILLFSIGIFFSTTAGIDAALIKKNVAAEKQAFRKSHPGIPDLVRMMGKQDDEGHYGAGLDEEKDVVTNLHTMKVAFLPWLFFFLFYRAVLYVCLGARAFSTQ